MAGILKLNRHNSKKEIEFELRFLKSLSIAQRFKMMFKKTKEIVELLEKSGYRRPFEIIKRDINNKVMEVLSLKRAYQDEARRSQTPRPRGPQISEEIEEKESAFLKPLLTP